MTLQNRLFASLIRLKLKNKKILIAVSGGLDSICLLHALNAMKPRFQLELVVGHIHHGGKNQYRSKSEKFVKDLSKTLNLKCVVIKSKSELKTENEMRDFRHKSLKKILEKENCNVIALAHHRDDLLESRLIRLIRGVGEQGLQSMTELQESLWRPFLDIPREEFTMYSKQNKLKFLNDPSNRSKKYFRNWIRNTWLPLLENYRPGSKSSLFKSLENLTVKKPQIDLTGLVTEEGISRSGLLGLDKSDQRRVLAHYLRKKEVKNYTSSHVDEILKRLDSSRKALTFRVIGLDWTVDAWHIRCLTS